MPTRNKIFVSYSHKDRKLFEEFKTMLAPAMQRGLVDLWDDQKIPPGSKWKEEIQKALSSASVAVLLVSQNFLASHFITENELPPLLQAAREEGVTIFWICLSSCLFEHTEIKSYQAAHDISRPLDRLPKSQRQEVLAKACAKLIQADAERQKPIQAEAERHNPIRAAAMNMSRLLQASLKKKISDSYFSDVSRYTLSSRSAALLVYATLPVTTSVDFTGGKITRFNTDEHPYWNYRDPDLRRAMVTYPATVANLAERLVQAHANLTEAIGQNAVSFGASQAYYFTQESLYDMGETLLKTWLRFEANVVNDAVDASVRIASLRASGQSVDIQNELDKLQRVISRNYDERFFTVFGMRADGLIKIGLLSIQQAFQSPAM